MAVELKMGMRVCVESERRCKEGEKRFVCVCVCACVCECVCVCVCVCACVCACVCECVCVCMCVCMERSVVS